MRSKVVVLVLFIGFYSVKGYGEGNWRSDGKDGEKGTDDDKKCNDDGNCGDDDKYLYEPCDYPDDIDCVRKFFGTYGQCSVIHHEDDKPVFREKYISYFPNFNLTLITTKVRLRELNGKIKRFYINKKTGNLVISVDFKGIEINSKVAIFVVSRRGREPAIAKDVANATYPVTLTAVIPVNAGLTVKALKESRVTGFLPQPVIEFYLGPKFSQSKDPAIAASYAALVADVPTAIQEDILAEGPSFFLAYLQKYICDFGIPLSTYTDIQSAYHNVLK